MPYIHYLFYFIFIYLFLVLTISTTNISNSRLALLPGINARRIAKNDECMYGRI